MVKLPGGTDTNVDGVSPNTHDVLGLVEGARRRRAPRQRHPPDQLVPLERVLDVDVAPVRFEPGAVLAAALFVIDQHEDPIAVDFVPSRRQRREIGRRQELERAGEARVHPGVARRIRQRVEDHFSLGAAICASTSSLPATRSRCGYCSPP